MLVWPYPNGKPGLVVGPCRSKAGWGRSGAGRDAPGLAAGASGQYLASAALLVSGGVTRPFSPYEALPYSD